MNKWFVLITLILAWGSALAQVPSVSSGSITRLEQFASQYIPPRNVDIWLPDTYDGKTPHAVLYMHDGQMLYDANLTWNKQEWQVDEVAAALIASGDVRPFIVVGVFNGGSNRHSEYFPQQPFLSLTSAQQKAAYASMRSADTLLFSAPTYSDAYLSFLVRELKPYIDSNFAVSTDRDATFVMGSSMGGLISMYAMLEYPNVFGGAACISTHWPGIMPSDDNPVPAAFKDYLQRKLPPPQAHRIYFDHGTATLDAYYPPLQAEVDKVMRQKVYPQELWQTQVFEGAAHTETDWAKRLHIPMTFLLQAN